MPVTLDRTNEPVAVNLSVSDTPAEACQLVADHLAAMTGAVVTVFLAVVNGLRSFGASGTWRMYYSVPVDVVGIGEAFRTGATLTGSAAEAAESGYPLTPPAEVARYVPVPANNSPIGVIRLEFEDEGQADAWQETVESTAASLGGRLADLRYAPRETMAERLVRYALSIVSSSNETCLMVESLRAARDLSGLSTAVVISPFPPDNRVGLRTETGRTDPLTERVLQLSPAALIDIGRYTHRFGPWFTVGDPADAVAPAPAALLEIGARTVIAVPIGPGREGDQVSGLSFRSLLLLDESTRQTNALTVGLLELLAAQAFISLERLRLLESLRAQARRDPLTGLGHQATFGERMAHAEPGRTALLLMDVDHFKDINDSRGHAAGDQTLVDLVAAVKGVMRGGDELYRIGGDEFVAVVEVGRAAEARGIAKRIAEAAHRVGCTVSIGVAIQAPAESADDALRRADAAMYMAKRDGRDRVQLAALPGRDRGNPVPST